MRGAERVHREHVAQRRVALRERLVVRELPDVEAHVLEQHDLTLVELGGGVEVVGDEPHGPAQQLAQALGDGCQGIVAVRLPLRRAAEVGHDHDPGAGLERVLEGRDRGPQPRVRADPSAVERHVQVLADQQALAGERQRLHQQHGHGPGPPYFAFTIASIVSSIRLEKPHSLSYHEQTLTRRPPIARVSSASTVDEALVWL